MVRQFPHTAAHPGGELAARSSNRLFQRRGAEGLRRAAGRREAPTHERRALAEPHRRPVAASSSAGRRSRRCCRRMSSASSSRPPRPTTRRTNGALAGRRPGAQIPDPPRQRQRATRRRRRTRRDPLRGRMPLASAMGARAVASTYVALTDTFCLSCRWPRCTSWPATARPSPTCSTAHPAVPGVVAAGPAGCYLAVAGRAVARTPLASCSSRRGRCRASHAAGLGLAAHADNAWLGPRDRARQRLRLRHPDGHRHPSAGHAGHLPLSTPIADVMSAPLITLACATPRRPCPGHVAARHQARARRRRRRPRRRHGGGARPVRAATSFAEAVYTALRAAPT